MARVVEIPASSGSKIFIEVDSNMAQGTQRIAVDAGARALEKVTGTFEDALANIQHVANGFYASLSELASKPETAEVEFGVKLTGGAGIIIASGTAEANIKVKLSWKADRP